MEKAGDFSQLGGFLAVCPERHNFLEVVKLVHVPSRGRYLGYAA